MICAFFIIQWWDKKTATINFDCVLLVSCCSSNCCFIMSVSICASDFIKSTLTCTLGPRRRSSIFIRRYWTPPYNHDRGYWADVSTHLLHLTMALTHLRAFVKVWGGFYSSYLGEVRNKFCHLHLQYCHLNLNHQTILSIFHFSYYP